MKHYSNGKLLITGEYLVLNGAKALALPTKFGQDIAIDYLPDNKRLLYWKSLTNNELIWFECIINLASFKVVKTSDSNVSTTLLKLLLKAKSINTNFLATNDTITVKTNLSFNRNWGLGTSSTLVNNIAQWAKVDAYSLQFSIFGGSGYDIGCAQSNESIIYQLENKQPLVKEINFNPVFKEAIFFIYLNKKQNSREAIKSYKEKNISQHIIKEVSDLTLQISKCTSLVEFEFLIKMHEKLLSRALQIKPIQERLFNDYFGQIKSLGAWGGDFILVTGNSETEMYFKKKGYHTIIPYTNIILPD